MYDDESGDEVEAKNVVTGKSTAVQDEFELLLSKLEGVELWTCGEHATYFAFFCHGWYGRSDEAEYQS